MGLVARFKLFIDSLLCLLATTLIVELMGQMKEN